MKKKWYAPGITFMLSLIFFYAFNRPAAKPGAHIHSGHDKLGKMQWLLGHWENKAVDGNYYESWKKISETAYSGESYFIRGIDTLSAELVSLEQKNDDLFYIPVVKGQNKGKPVSFRLTSMDGKFVFENPAHDFPQVITYQLITPDSLLAEISGMVDGKLRKEQFPMSRSRKK